jgi:hypothetical protein
MEPILLSPNIFITLAIIDFESARRSTKNKAHEDYYQLLSNFSCDGQLKVAREWVYEYSVLFKTWQILFKITPNFYFRSWIYSKTINSLDFEIANIWFFADTIRIKVAKKYIHFYPPCFDKNEKWKWGKVEIRHQTN